MDFSLLVNKGVRSMLPYRMGKPVELVQQEIGCKNLLRLNAGENPYGMSRKVSKLLCSRLDRLPLFPDPSAYTFKQFLNKHYSYAPFHITAGADSQELISLITRAFLNEQVSAIVPAVNSFSLERTVALTGARLVKTPINDDWIPSINELLAAVDSSTRMILIANPSNPLGAFMVYSDIEYLLDRLPEHVIVVIDEELVDFIGDGYKDLYPLIENHPNIAIVRSFSHAYGLADLRVGYMLSGSDICGIVNVLRDPFNVSQLALECACEALQDKSFINFVLKRMQTERNRYTNFCAYYGLPILDTKTCSVTIDFANQANVVYSSLLREGIFTRPLNYLGLPSLINITLGHPEENDFVLARLEKIVFEVFPQIAKRESLAEEEKAQKIQKVVDYKQLKIKQFHERQKQKKQAAAQSKAKGKTIYAP